ncbi:MAG: ATP-binding cassette domain-containing protein [bacterium]
MQESFLFSGTIYDNIRMGRLAAADKEIAEAAEKANAWKFIKQLPNGIHTTLGEDGIRLSGGQKQLIAIARAILRKAPIVLLDEATSAMDAETEYTVQQSLETLLKNRTSIVIAHRLSTIQSADNILVMRNGKIEEQGRHIELMEQDGYYKRLYTLQNWAQAKDIG